MDEHLTNIIETAILDYQNDGDKAREQHLMECFVSQAVTAAGYRLDPYPNGKTKGELIKRIEELEAERDKARNLLRQEHGFLLRRGYLIRDELAWKMHKEQSKNCKVCAFLNETSLVKP